MKLTWTRRALRQLSDAHDYIAFENPAAARQVVERVAHATLHLLEHPKIGKPGRVSGTHEWIVAGTAYFIVYVLAGDTVQIIRLLHGKQSWPPKPR